MPKTNPIMQAIELIETGRIVEDFISQPGQPVTFRLTYGNHGCVAVSDVAVAMPSSPALIFESALPPAIYNPQLAQHEWHIGALPANSGPHTIVITATIAPSASWLKTYTYIAAIDAPAAEAHRANNTAFGEFLLARRLYLPLMLRNRLN